MRILVLYSYYESERARANLEFFNRFGLYRTVDVEYCLIVAGGICSVNLSSRWSKKILRPNEGFDFASWKEGLSNYNLEEFDYFAFLNDTVIGPLGERDWLEVFISKIDERTKLVGTTINRLSLSKVDPALSLALLEGEEAVHIQAMFWLTDRLGCLLAWEKVFSWEEKRKQFIIVLQEIGLSQAFLKAGYSISCLSTFQGSGDPYLNTNKERVHPLEVIFYKNSRYDEPKLRIILALQKEINYY